MYMVEAEGFRCKQQSPTAPNEAWEKLQKATSVEWSFFISYPRDYVDIFDRICKNFIMMNIILFFI